MGALQNIIQTYSRSYSAGLQLSLLTILGIGHVTTLPTTYKINPDMYHHPYLVFFHLLIGCWLNHASQGDPGLHPDWVHDCDFVREWNVELYHQIQCLREVILEEDLAYLVVH